MFENLTDRLNNVFTQLRRRGKLSENDVDVAMREVRLALLEADVHYGVVKDFVARVRERSIGAEVSKALNPAQQVIKIVNEELIATLGEPERVNLSRPKPRVLMLVGLQGSGKTTAAGKIARLLRSQGERVMLVAGDPYRPAAIQQLQTLGERLNVPVHAEAGILPPELVARAYTKAQNGGYTVLIVDTAGRSQLDDDLMNELRAITRRVEPAEILLVVDAMIGQEAVNIAQGFRDAVTLTGLVLAKIDGDARGGAAISIRSVTGVPIKFLGTGEALDALEVFEPSRLSSRILGMGDVLGLIEKAEAAFDEKVAREQAEKALPNDPARRLDALLGANMQADAEPVYRQLVTADPSNLDLHFDHIQNHFNIPAVKQAGQANAEIVAYYTALSEDPITRDIGLFGLGLIQAKQKEFKDAIKYYGQVSDRNLKYLNLWTGKAFRELEDNRIAEGFFRREISAGGEVNGAVSDLLSLYLEQNQVEKLRALKNDPQLAPFIEAKYQRKLALKTGELSTYLWYVFFKPVQNLSLEGILCALLVGTVWFVYFRRIDVFAGEPLLLSLGMLGAGALSALLSLIFSDNLKEILPLSLGQGWITDLTFTVLHIGLVEEVAKFLPVLLVLPFVRRPREPFDLLFYGSLSALGFATLENALYFTIHGIGITASRFVFSTVMHMCMTGIVSYAYARALYIRPGRLIPALLAGLAASALVHGLFDFFLLGAQSRFTTFSIFVLLIAAREFYRTIQTTLNYSPFFDKARSTSPRLNNYGLLFSSTAAFFSLVFLFQNHTTWTEIANKQLASLMLISLPSIFGVFTAMGRLYLCQGQVYPFLRLSLIHRMSTKWSIARRLSTNPGDIG